MLGRGWGGGACVCWGGVGWGGGMERVGDYFMTVMDYTRIPNGEMKNMLFSVLEGQCSTNEFDVINSKKPICMSRFTSFTRWFQSGKVHH